MKTRHGRLHLCLFLLTCELIHGEWTPRSRFWKHIQDSEKGLLVWNKNDELEDQYDNIKTCLEEGLHEEATTTTTTTTTIESSAFPKVVDMLNDTDGTTTLLVEIQSAITPEQVAAVKALAKCAREYVPNYYEHRDFHSSGGNDVSFMNIILQLFLPQVAATLQRTAELAYVEARWQAAGYPPPGTLGLRTTEYLSYRDFKFLGEHPDGGSIYTILFALGHPKDYQGGEYFIRDSNRNKYYFKPRQYSAIVFLSESNHGVTDISSGHREMFTNELWQYDDPPWPNIRPLHSSMELFLERCEEMDAGSSWPAWPRTEDVEKWVAETGRGGIEDEKYEVPPDNEDDREEL